MKVRPSDFDDLFFAGVRSVDGRTHDILFVGTTHGRVLKIVNSISGKKTGSEPVLIESLQVFPYHVAVRNILVVHPKSEPGKLIVLSDHEVHSIPLHRCQAPAAQSCADCVAMQVKFHSFTSLFTCFLPVEHKSTHFSTTTPHP